MAYDRKKLFEQAKKLIVDNELFFVEDIVSLLPCDKTTFYKHFPPESNELNELKRLLEISKTNIKVKLRKKWEVSDNATVQMALMKLIGSEDERRKLSMTYQQHSGDEENPVRVSNEHHVYFHKYDEPKGDE